MMNISQIEALLDKYWSGESTLEEERLLKAYFASGDVDPRLRKFAPLFAALTAEQSVEYARPATVRNLGAHRFQWHQWAAAASVALLLAAGGWMMLRQGPKTAGAPQVVMVNEAPAERQTIITNETQPQQNQPVIETPQNNKVKRKYRAIVKSVKAVMASNRIDPAEKAEAEKAYAEVKAALALVSSKLGKGRKEASKSLNQLETIDKIFKKRSTEG